MRASAKRAAVTFSAPGFTSARCIINAPGAVVASESFGGWEFVERPQNSALPVWRGYAPFTLTVPVLFDTLDTGASLERDITALETLAGRGNDPTVKPPAVFIRSNIEALIPRNGEQTRWLITALEWEDALRNSAGDRVRQPGTVTVTRYIDPNIKVKSAPKRAGHARGHKLHVVKKGETLVRISTKEYGTPDRWQDIAKANKVHDPRHLKVGQRLRLPK